MTGRSLAAGLALGMTLVSPAQVASADGLVIESGASNHAVGDVIEAGAMVTLGADESLVVLDQSGEVFTLTASAPYAAGTLSQGADDGLSMADAAFNPGRRSDIGGTRTEDYETCLANAQARADLDPADCDRAQPEAPAAPALTVGLAVRAATFNPGDRLIFRLKSSFDSRVSCSATQVGNGDTAAPMELAGDGSPLRLMSNVSAMAPQRGSPRLVAPDVPGLYRVECLAVDRAAWDAYQSATAELTAVAADPVLLSRFAGLRGADIATGTVDVTVVE
ncbi:MAG: hypothetical protein AAF253_05340 [Pseudomonadota bacterium]